MYYVYYSNMQFFLSSFAFYRQAYVPNKQPYINYLSVYNDGCCSSLSAGMHETVDNIGLRQHAEENNGEYFDESGIIMGFSLKDENGPMKCFNTAKPWQL